MIPPVEKWMSLAEAAKKLGVRASQLHSARKNGRKSRSGQLVVLICWKTLRGYVTTAEQIEDFHRLLNE